MVKKITQDGNNLTFEDDVQTTPRDLNEVAFTLSNQTIAGVKTFTSIPVGPAVDPTADNEFTRKLYVDNAANANGWIPADQTFTFDSDDDPTYTFTIAAFDATTKYGIGMKIKLTDGGTQFFIITKVIFDNPGSTITIFGGTGYDLSGGAITNPFYSAQKAPLDFKLDHAIWDLATFDDTGRTQAAAVQNTWYNLGAVSLVIHIGEWNVEYMVIIEENGGAQALEVTLSDANNTESIIAHTSASKYTSAGDRGPTYRVNPLSVATKTTYYINTRTVSAGTPTIFNRNNLSRLIIRATNSFI